ncbi:MAG: LytTR family DNA-binding domain-containing protein [Bacteroidales bacterium]|nr:LytTR family DNA-binding domain-containing protein [Bacteroidales bacterium]
MQNKKKYFCTPKNNKMEIYKYIIIDDEHQSHQNLRRHIMPYSKYQCVATFKNPQKALLYLQTNEVDLIFLDIRMPEMNGFQFLESLSKNIFVVILTAYVEQYSIEAHQYYDKDLVFFSNKSQFSYYFPKIMTRFENMFKEKAVLNRIKQLSKNEIRIFPKKYKNKTISLEDIVYLEVVGHNMVLKIRNGEEIIFRMTIGELLSFLPTNFFFQIKRNMIINIIYITALTGTTISIENQHLTIPISKRKKIIPQLITLREKLLENYCS